MNLASRPATVFLFSLSLPLFASSTASGIKNFHEVDDHVYRGAQPNAQGFEYLASLGVKTVIDLREYDERARAEESIVKSAGMGYVSVPMTGLTPPSDREITSILAILEDGRNGPVFVHCKRGADRTGAVIAAYRIDHQGWDNAHALSEAMANGMSIFQLPRQTFIRNFQGHRLEAKTILDPKLSRLQSFKASVLLGSTR